MLGTDRQKKRGGQFSTGAGGGPLFNRGKWPTFQPGLTVVPRYRSATITSSERLPARSRDASRRQPGGHRSPIETFATHTPFADDDVQQDELMLWARQLEVG